MASLVRGLAGLARRAPALTIVVVLLLTGVFGFFAGQAEQDQSQEAFSPDNPTLEAASFAQETFEGGSTATIVQVVVEAGDGQDVVSPEGLATADGLREAILAGVPAETLSTSQGGSPIISWLLPIEQAVASGEVPEAALAENAGVDQVYTDAFAQLPPEAVGITEGLVAVGDGEAAVDGDTALLLLFLETEVITEGLEGVDAQTEAVVAAVQDVVDVVAAADVPLEANAFAFELFFVQDDSFTNEIGRLFGTAALIIVLILFAVYLFPPKGPTTRPRALRRAAADTGLTLFVIFASIGWMQGIGTLLGPDYLGVIGAFSPPTQIIPILLIGLGVDYAIHMTSRYREELSEGASVDRAVERASTTVGVALLLATMTTVLGFLTNITNPVPAIADFGVLAAVGIAVAFLLMLTFLPAARILLDRRAERTDTLPREAVGAGSEGVLSKITESTAVLGERFAWSVAGVTVLLGALGGYGLTQLSTEFSFADFVPADNPVRETFLTIDEEFGGGFGEQSQVVVEGDVATVEAHNAIVEAVAELAAIDGVVTVGENASADSVVARIGQQLQLAQLAQQPVPEGGEGAPATGPPGAPPLDPAALQAAGEFAGAATAMGLQPDLTVADGTDVAALYDLLIEVDPTATGVLGVDGDSYVGAQAVVQTQSATVGANALAADLEAAFDDVAAATDRVTATGNAIIGDAIVGDLSSSQVSSLITTLIAALVLLVLVFGIRDRRPVLGAITLFPVFLVVLWVFGMMAATGIPFGPVTSTISGLAIGIGVPFTIHITNRFVEDLEELGTVDAALRSTLRHTGGALAGSAFTTAAGFAILVTSSLIPFRQLGLVVTYAIVFSLVAAILVLPSLLAIWARRTGQDVEPVGPDPTEPAAAGV